ncbi:MULTISPECIES: hypothetical protein [Sporosarcina]|uniref:Uncharacterized protein n=1 Tax=Sporosarcina newyorkensis TaxID=759851 RepID=A0A1T4XRQ9_9BACL|nr:MULTISPECIES: hypothetical protein [Sporosarcina]MBY0222303.1 hypothetical protein [Sporosarcina aquimarina]SKA92237.1 hypothetical protein SAMN04244570_1272 [Sporosarcina newyorkensis]
MFRNGKVVLLLLLAVVLVGCNQKVEGLTDEGFVAAREAFEANAKKTNEAAGDIHFYKPTTMEVDKQSTSQTIVLTKRNDSFYLTVNPNEKKNSRVYYDLLMTDEPENLVGAQTFAKDEVFGFVAVIQKSEKLVELIASVGGVKVETVTDEKNIDSHLGKMMQIARSVQQDEK